MRSFSVVELNPCAEFPLQLLNAFEHAFAEDFLVELLQYSAIEALADTIRLR